MLGFKKFFSEAPRLSKQELETIKSTAAKISGYTPQTSEEKPTPKIPRVRKQRPPKDPTKSLSTIDVSSTRQSEIPDIKTASKDIEDVHAKLSAMPYNKRTVEAKRIIERFPALSQAAYHHLPTEDQNNLRQQRPKETSMWEKQNPHLFDPKIKSFDLNQLKK